MNIRQTGQQSQAGAAILIMTKTYPIPGLGGRMIRLSGVLVQPPA